MRRFLHAFFARFQSIKMIVGGPRTTTGRNNPTQPSKHTSHNRTKAPTIGKTTRRMIRSRVCAPTLFSRADQEIHSPDRITNPITIPRIVCHHITAHSKAILSTTITTAHSTNPISQPAPKSRMAMITQSRKGVILQNAITVRYHTVSEETPNQALFFKDGGSSSGGISSRRRWTRRSGARKTIQSTAPTNAAPTHIAQTFGNVTPQINGAYGARVREKTPNDGRVAVCSSFAGNRARFGLLHVLQDGVGQSRPSDRDQRNGHPKQAPFDDLQGIANPNQDVFRRRLVIAGIPRNLTKHAHALRKSERQTSHFSKASVSKETPNWRIAA